MKSILIIEDNNDIRENLAEILQLSGYNTFEAENGKRGIEQANLHKPDLIICDVMMPELDGFGVLKILSQNKDLMDIPFMFLTAKADKIDFRKGMGLGADDYITKPFDDKELLEAIEIRLKKSSRMKPLENPESSVQLLYDIKRGDKVCEELIKDKEIRKYTKKDTIYEAHQYPRWLYYLKNGLVKCFTVNDFGKELITNVFTSGEFIGYAPIIQESKYYDNAVALEDSELILISSSEYKKTLFNNRDFAAKFFITLSKDNQNYMSQLSDLAYSSVRKKVAIALLIFENKSSGNTMQVMRDDLAALAGATKETTVRTLTDFKREGLLKIESNEITILDRKSLENMPQ